MIIFDTNDRAHLNFCRLAQFPRRGERKEKEKEKKSYQSLTVTTLCICLTPLRRALKSRFQHHCESYYLAA